MIPTASEPPSTVSFFLRSILPATTLAALAIPFATAEMTQPLDQPEHWTFADPAAWEWTETDDQTTLVLTRQSDFKPEVRRPRNLAWFNATEWESFSLTVEVRLDLFNEGNNDVCIAFAQSSETRFYYAHLGQKADAVHLQIHLVDDADRKAITEIGADSLPWKPNAWHTVKLERNVESGTITVWFDNAKVLSATDKSLGKGKIGLGSFDDLGSFRNLEISPN